MKYKAIEHELEELANLIVSHEYRSSPLKLQIEIFVNTYIHTGLDNLFKTLAILDDASDPHMKRLKQIKKDKSYLNRYIKAFKNMNDVSEAVGDQKECNFYLLDIKLFENFQSDSINIMNVFSFVKTIIAAHPEWENLVKQLKNKPKLTDKEKSRIKNFHEYYHINKISKFFEGYDITRDKIIVASSIFMYKQLQSELNLPKYSLKDILETIYSRLGIPVNIYPDKIDDAFFRGSFKSMPIWSYPSETDIEPQIRFDIVEKILTTQIEKLELNGKEIRAFLLKKYLSEEVLHIKKRLLNP